jgi:hypothetical protein
MGEMDLGLGSCRNNFVEWRSDRRNVLSTGRIPQYARPRRLELMIHVGANDFNTVTISASITSIGRIQRMMLPPTANEYSRPDAVIYHWRLCGTETHTRCRACTIARIHNEISSAHLVLNSITNTRHPTGSHCSLGTIYIVTETLGVLQLVMYTLGWVIAGGSLSSFRRQGSDSAMVSPYMSRNAS